MADDGSVTIGPEYIKDLAAQVSAYSSKLTVPAQLQPVDPYVASPFPESDPLGRALTDAKQGVVSWHDGVVSTLNFIAAYLLRAADLIPGVDQNSADKIKAAISQARDDALKATPNGTAPPPKAAPSGT